MREQNEHVGGDDEHGHAERDDRLDANRHHSRLVILPRTTTTMSASLRHHHQQQQQQQHQRAISVAYTGLLHDYTCARSLTNIQPAHGELATDVSVGDTGSSTARD